MKMQGVTHILGPDIDLPAFTAAWTAFLRQAEM